MGRMAEVWQEQQEQENESGIDMHDCYHAHFPLERIELTKKENENEHSNHNFRAIGNRQVRQPSQSRPSKYVVDSGDKKTASV